MKARIVLLIFSLCLSPLAWSTTPCCTKPDSQPSEPAKPQEKPSQCGTDELGEILAKMKKATQQLTSCQAEISYLFIQDPDLLDSKTLRNGMLYYQKDDDRSQLRIRFDDIKQEDFPPEERREEYLFDGVWLTRIDFKLKQIDRIQQAPEDNPIGVFELISHNFPLIGFANIDQLSSDFDIQIPEETNDPNEAVHLLLNVKKGSKYAKEYQKIDFWVTPDSYMPERIVAHAAQGDIHDIKFNELQINKKFKNAVFTVETPPDFRKNVEQLEEKSTKKGN